MEKTIAQAKDGKWQKVAFGNYEQRKATLEHARECETRELRKIQSMLLEKGLEFLLIDNDSLFLERDKKLDGNKGSATIKFSTKKGNWYAEDLELKVPGSYLANIPYVTKHYKYDFVKGEASPKFYESLLAHIEEVDRANAKSQAQVDSKFASLDTLTKILDAAKYKYKKFPESLKVLVGEGSSMEPGIMLTADEALVSTEIRIDSLPENVLDLLDILEALQDTLKKKALTRIDIDKLEGSK